LVTRPPPAARIAIVFASATPIEPAAEPEPEDEDEDGEGAGEAGSPRPWSPPLSSNPESSPESSKPESSPESSKPESSEADADGVGSVVSAVLGAADGSSPPLAARAVPPSARAATAPTATAAVRTLFIRTSGAMRR
jgi:hypothetical protein